MAEGYAGAAELSISVGGVYDDARQPLLQTAGCFDDQAAFAAQLKELLARDGYRATGMHDDRHFERYVQASLRKIAKMTKANDGFANTMRYQG